MTTAVSIIVPSRGRSEDLKRCLVGLGQLYHQKFEVIVVADGPTLAEIDPIFPIKRREYDKANVAAARNIGAQAAAGEIIAFIDDDAVPEPTWLSRLCDPFADETVAASGGFVIGRNGISLQWGALSIDPAGWDHPIPLNSDASTCLTMQPGPQAIRTQGTNMAVRRSALCRLGGFDQAFRFSYEESDLNFRIGQSGMKTAIVPLAQVHHRTARSAIRNRERTPSSLFEIGASTAAFHKKHLKETKWAQARTELVTAQRRRLLSMMVTGRLEPRDVNRLEATLLDGYHSGLERAVGVHQTIGPADQGFLQVPVNAGPTHEVLYGPRRRAASLRQSARANVRTGTVTTVMLFETTSRFHKVRFRSDGYWEHSGGLYGKAVRTEPLFRVFSRQRRAEIETRRIGLVRNP